MAVLPLLPTSLVGSCAQPDRARANAHAALISESDEVAKDSRFGEDSESAIGEAIAGVHQQESDPAPYCTPSYVEMEIGASLLLLGKPRAALPVFEASRAEWPDSAQARDNALCLARLAAAYASADDKDKAVAIAEEAIIASRTLASWRIVSQLEKLSQYLAKWSRDPSVANLIERLDMLTRSSRCSPHLKG